MSTIQIEVPDTLAQKLAPHQEHLVELLELGLQKWLERKEPNVAIQQEKILQSLATTGQISLPKPYLDKEPYVTHTPVQSTGTPASEIVVEQRGTL